MMRERSPNEIRLESAMLKYVERFGSEALVMSSEWPGGYPDASTLADYYERCLQEGKPLRHYVTPTPFDPDIII